MPTPIIQLIGVTKKFGSFIANQAIDLAVQPSEIHAIVGENGAGKSTLMKTLAGLHLPEEGRILLRGEEVLLGNPEIAMRHGIGMVHQHFSLIESLTVTENVVLSNPPQRGGVFRKRHAEQLVRELGDRYGLTVDPRRRIADCRVGVQQRTEILKALYRNPDVLILDEPTAVLTPQEARSLMENLRTLRDNGKTIIFITHKLQEVMAIADRVTVMRAGRIVLETEISKTSPNALAVAMVGHEIHAERKEHRPDLGNKLLELDHVTCSADGVGGSSLHDVSMTLRAGEVLGVAGVEGNGQSELVEIVTGLRLPNSGTVRLKGVDVTKASSPAAMRSLGVAHIPENRISTGLATTAPLMDNLIMGVHRSAPVARGIWIDQDAARDHARKLVQEFDVRPGDIRADAGSLSGGNMQKAIVARELTGDPEIIVAAHPTRGVDIGAAEFIYEQLLRRRDKAAVLLVSSDLDEVLRLSDRIVVMYRGSVMAEVLPQGLTSETLGLLMAGIKPAGGVAAPGAGGVA
ncbi:ABC transporter ATP-binding protein [Mesorhizobium sp. BAC0120]|uniref:ABC transporter ATP-binding protein n=1 Tax=Mesorhizobium sp. BAC0120 TaxID=3090670 RepID=UPI00298BD299|nr:ABC transporter ATP-binding protein [Mesorhizobium sp. BAC0120]MDW6023409.1 ABC transporter ATP-binding protein [Mesorhizobium sp. BAC0120]